MDSRLGVAIVGCGYWGKNYFNTLVNSDRAKIKWIFNKNNNPEFDFPENIKFTKNYKEILEDEEVSSVIISTPPHTHYRLATEAIESGKNVLLEKPMVLTSKEALSLESKVKSSNLVFMVGHIYLYHDHIKTLKKIIETEELGKIKSMYSRRMAPGPSRSDINAMWNLASHDISIFNYLLDESPRSVLAKRSSPSQNMNDSFRLELNYSNGISCSADLSWSNPTKERILYIEGEKGHVIFDETGGNKLIIKIGNEKREIDSPKRSPLENECNHFFDCIEKNHPPLTGIQEGEIDIKILETADMSIKKGGKIQPII